MLVENREIFHVISETISISYFSLFGEISPCSVSVDIIQMRDTKQALNKKTNKSIGFVGFLFCNFI